MPFVIPTPAAVVSTLAVEWIEIVNPASVISKGICLHPRGGVD